MVLYQFIVTCFLLAFLRLLRQNLKDYCPPPDGAPSGRPLVSILVPARNEAENITHCLQSLLAQDYPNIELLALDDDSEDDTAECILRLARGDGRLRLIKGKPIQSGWAGKAWACHQLGAQASGEWLIFIDADTRAQPDLVRRAVAFAETTGAGMASAFPKEVTVTWPERLVIPMIHWVLLTFLPIRQIRESPSPAFAAACGQFELFSRAAYQTVGGHEAVQHSFHDGLQLARKIKGAGLGLRLFDGTDLISCRMYHNGAEVWNGFTRNAYEGIGSLPALLVITALEGLLFLAPFLFLLSGLASRSSWALVCVLQVVLIYSMRLLLAVRFGNRRAIWLHPVSAAAIIGIQWASFFRSRWRKQGVWKGRVVG